MEERIPRGVDLIIFHSNPYAAWTTILERYGEERLALEAKKALFALGVSEKHIQGAIEHMKFMAEETGEEEPPEEDADALWNLFYVEDEKGRQLAFFLFLLAVSPQWETLKEGILAFVIDAYIDETRYKIIPEEMLYYESFVAYFAYHRTYLPTKFIPLYLKLGAWKEAETLFTRAKNIKLMMLIDYIPHILACIYIREGKTPELTHFFTLLEEKYTEEKVNPPRVITYLRDRLRGKAWEEKEPIPAHIPKELILEFFRYNPFTTWKEVVLHYGNATLAKEAWKSLSSLLPPIEVKKLRSLINEPTPELMFVTIFDRVKERYLTSFLIFLILFARGEKSRAEALISHLSNYYGSWFTEFYMHIGEVLDVMGITPRKHLAEFVGGGDWITARRIIERNATMYDSSIVSDLIYTAIIDAYILYEPTPAFKDFLNTIKQLYVGEAKDEFYSVILDIEERVDEYLVL